MSNKKAIIPNMLIASGDNLFPLSHPGNKLKHLNNEFKAQKKSANWNKKVIGRRRTWQSLKYPLFIPKLNSY